MPLNQLFNQFINRSIESCLFHGVVHQFVGVFGEDGLDGMLTAREVGSPGKLHQQQPRQAPEDQERTRHGRHV